MKALTVAIRLTSRCVVATFFVAAISGACNAAPKGLLGKSIKVRAAATFIVETPEGKTYPQHITGEHVIYISTRGRVFDRTNQVDETNTDRKSNNFSHEPGDLNWNFIGNKLEFSKTEVGVHTVHTISFDATFQTCHYSAHFKVLDPAGGQYFNGTRFRSATVDMTSCAIQDGNAFAN